MKLTPTWWVITLALPAAVLLLFPPPLRRYAFAAMVSLDLGHTVAPIIAAWSRQDLRRLMLGRKKQCILWPLAALLVAVAIGAATQFGWTTYDPRVPHADFMLTDADNFYPMLCWGYWLWNIYHFGMQNFGFARLCGLPGSRRTQRIVGLGLTSAAMVALPHVLRSPPLFLALIATISVNHWIVELDLSSRIAGRWLVPVSLFLGSIAFMWTIPTENGNLIRVIPWLLSARMGLGFVHFLYDRWLYRFSDPAVQATIGKAVFG